MSEIKDIKPIYPRLPRTDNNNNNDPSAPVAIIETIDDNGISFRLKKISEVGEFLEKEIKERQRLGKKYLKISNTIDNVSSGLTVVSIGAGAGGVALLSTVVAIPVTIALESFALITGLGTVLSKIAIRKTRTKSEKHRKIQYTAESKLNTLNALISKAITDNEISHEEFKLILAELEKYKKMKNDIRNKTKEKMNTDNEKNLIEQGKKQAMEEFKRLMENPIASLQRLKKYLNFLNYLNINFPVLVR